MPVNAMAIVAAKALIMILLAFPFQIILQFTTIST